MVDVMIMDPLNLARNSLQLETQAFRDGAARGVFGRAFNRDPVELPDLETMIDHRAATGGHDAPALVPGVQPIAKGRPAVDPIHIQMVDDPAKLALMPDPREKSAIVGVLLEPVANGPLHRPG